MKKLEKFTEKLENAGLVVIVGFCISILIVAIAAPYIVENNFSADSIVGTILAGSWVGGIVFFAAVMEIANRRETPEEYYKRRVKEMDDEIRRLVRNDKKHK